MRRCSFTFTISVFVFLAGSDKQNLHWTRLAGESTGLANLARLQGIHGDTNTVFARVTIQSDADRITKMKFGFSDDVKVFLNDRLIYGGSDVYQSRDYRFLGTLGFYDELYLPLRKGENEVWMAVTEHFGGWGIKAMLEDGEGVRIAN